MTRFMEPTHNPCQCPSNTHIFIISTVCVGKTANEKGKTNDETDKLEKTVYNRPKTYAEILVNDK